LQAFVSVAGLRVVVFLVVAEAKLTQGVLKPGILIEGGLEVGDGSLTWPAWRSTMAR